MSILSWIRSQTSERAVLPSMFGNNFGSHLTQTHQNIWILPNTYNKNELFNCWPSGKYVHLLYMYSILGRGSFCFNYCLNSAWHGGDQFVALLRWYGSPGFFDSGLQLIWICWSLVSHFPLDNSPYILDGVQVWWVCWPVKWPWWSFNQLLVLLAVWAGAKSYWKMKSASLKSWSAEGSMKCSTISW